MKQIAKRLTALLLAMAMCLSLLSANVWAAEELEDGTVSAQSSEETASEDTLEKAGDTSVYEKTDDLYSSGNIKMEVHENELPEQLLAQEETHIHHGVTYNEWKSSDSLPAEPGTYYLTADVRIHDWTAPAGNTVLCLNGHKIRVFDSDNDTGIIVNTGADLEIDDCDETTMGSYDRIYMRGGSISIKNGHGTISVGSGTANFYGGSVSGGEGGEAMWIGGGTVNIYGGNFSSWFRISGGTVNVYDGTLGNGSDFFRISAHGGTLNLLGGTITGIKDVSPLWVNGSGTVGVSGGTITSSGTAVYVEDGVFILEGGSVIGSDAARVDGGTLTMTAGTVNGGIYAFGGTTNIRGGTVIPGACGVYANDRGRVSVDGGKIAGGVYSDSSLALLEISGGYFSSKPDSKYVASGFSAWSNQDADKDAYPWTVIEHTHHYSDPVWYWSKDYKSALAKFTCKDNDDMQTIDAEVNEKTSPATTAADGRTVYTAKVSFEGKMYTDTKTETIPTLPEPEPIPEPTPEKQDNTITASNIVKSYSTKDQSFNLKASANGAPLTYTSSDKKKVSVKSNGKVKIKKKFAGTVTITITASETDTYKSATKTITITVPTVTNVKNATVGKGQMTVQWKKNTTATDYQVQCSTDKKFKKKNKTVKAKKQKTIKSVIKVKKGTYYVRIRTLNGKCTSDWSKAKTVTVK